mmetsp:Transcript_2497/g.9417  ORF Transcript_2497/g.9417 Transcript_2497/m.9417 type:complete len:94 (-) Transcript_2497:1789-2070(-)
MYWIMQEEGNCLHLSLTKVHTSMIYSMEMDLFGEVNCSCFGMSTVSTPFSILAFTLDVSQPSGMRNVLLKSEKRLSTLWNRDPSSLSRSLCFP